MKIEKLKKSILRNESSSKLRPLVYLLLISAFLINACSNSYVNNIERGGGYEYRPGFPELRLVTSSFIDEDNSTQINVAAEIVFGSLIYKKRGNIFQAVAYLDVEIADLANPDNFVENSRFPLKFENEKANIALSQETFLFEKEFNIKPGDYEITVTVTDSSTGKSSTRIDRSLVPDPSKEVSNITNIQILSKKAVSNSSFGFEPVTTYDVSEFSDSVKFVFQITNNKPNDPITVESKLYRFESDTSAARPLSFNNYIQGSIQYRGIKYNETEELNSSRRVLSDPGNVLIEFYYENLTRGNYRFEVTASSSNSKKDILYKARDFSIKSRNYPTLRTARELAQPLIYLMSKKEHERLMAIENNDSLKKAIDLFWIRNIKNSARAKDVVSLYYERVEQANKQFSGFKEGWKTDQGMMFILFGPPWYIDGLFDEMRWSYSQNTGDPEKNFYFFRPRIKNKFYPFDHFILRRDNSYHNLFYQQVQSWLNGNILRRNL